MNDEPPTAGDSILRSVADGQPNAVERCLDRYGGFVWSLASRYLRDRSEAEEATQEIFVELWRQAGRFDPRKSAEASFVALVARRRLIDRQRRQKSRPRLDSSVSLEDLESNSPPDPLIESEEVNAVRSGLEELRAEERAVIRLAVDEGLSQTEIAERLDLPLGTVKSHAVRGMKKLRAIVHGSGRADGKGGGQGGAS